jgi:uncharacterized membrane protein YiaA
MRTSKILPTSGAFVAASWASLFIGAGAFCVGLWNATNLALSERGYYFAVLLLGLYSAISLQKAVRDRLENVPVTGLYYGLSWVAMGAALLLLAAGLWNAELSLSEKGFYGMSFVLALFSSVAVQKNVRDRAAWEPAFSDTSAEEPAES